MKEGLNEKLTSNYKCFSVIDTRFAGCGKTTEAIMRNKETGYIHIFPNYELAFEKAQENPNAFVFLGRPKLCDKFDEDIYEFVSPSCKGCSKFGCCTYYRQKHEGQGMDVYTVPQNLEVALKWFKPTTIVFDDVSLIDIIYPHEVVSIGDLQKLRNFLVEHGFPILSELMTLILDRVDFLKDVGKEVMQFIRKHKDTLEREYTDLSEAWLSIAEERVKAKLIALLLKAKRAWIVGIFDEKGNRVVSISVRKFDRRNFFGKRLEYINATPQRIEFKLLEKLSTYPVKILSEEAPVRKHTTIIQVADAKFGSYDVNNGKNRKFNEINKVLDDFFAKTPDNSCVIFTSKTCMNIIRRCYKNLFPQKKDGKPSFKNGGNAVTFSENDDMGLKVVIIRGKRSSGTNFAINIYKGIITGISFLPPSFFIRAPYIEDFDKLRVSMRVTKSKENASFGEYENISRVYKNDDSLHRQNSRHSYIKSLYELLTAYGIDTIEPVRNSIIQAIARIARGKDDPKLIIIVSNIQVDDGNGFIPEVGAYVKKIRLGRLPKSGDYEKKAKKWIKPLINELQNFYKPIIISLVERVVRKKLNIITRKMAEDLSEQFGVFGWGWYYKQLIRYSSTWNEKEIV